MKILYISSSFKLTLSLARSSFEAIKNMAVVKTIVITIALILQFCFSDAGICSPGPRPEKYRYLCPQNLMETSNGSLPCSETICNDWNYVKCELSGRKGNNTIMNFTPQMCLTNEPLSTSYVGLRFNWTIPAGQTNVTGVKILVHHHPYPLTWILLNVDLTETVNNDQEKIFSTGCLASSNIHPGSNYFISVQVSRDEESEEWYQFPQSFTYNPDCWKLKLEERHLCAARPDYRPMPKVFCNGTVAVTVDSGFPPGIGPDTTEFQMEVLLKGVNNSFYHSHIISEQIVLGQQPSKRIVYFHNLDPGVYQVRMAFLDEDWLPCGNNYYTPGNYTLVNAPVDYRLITTAFCNGTIAVTIDSGFPQGIGPDANESQVEVRLTGVNNTFVDVRTIQIVVAFARQPAKWVVYFHNLDPGTYLAKMTILDEDGVECQTNGYKQGKVTILNEPPTMELSVEPPNACNKDVEVTIFANSNKRNQEHQFNVTVILSETNDGQETAKRVLLTMNPKTSSSIKKVYFENVFPGNYTVSTKFTDEHYSQCSSEETRELTVDDVDETEDKKNRTTDAGFW